MSPPRPTCSTRRRSPVSSGWCTTGSRQRSGNTSAPSSAASSPTSPTSTAASAGGRRAASGPARPASCSTSSGCSATTSPLACRRCGSTASPTHRRRARTTTARCGCGCTRTYYRPLSDWCEAHGIALCGHPQWTDDLGSERYFQIPGQDVIAGMILPGKPGAIDGRESVQAKWRLLVDGSPGPPAVQRGIARRLWPHPDLRPDEVADRLVPGAGYQPAVPARVLLLGARPPREGGAARRRTQQSLVGPLPALRRLLPAALLRKHRRPAHLRRGGPGRRLLRAVAGGARAVHPPARLQLPGGPPPVGGRADRRRRHPAWPACTTAR